MGILDDVEAIRSRLPGGATLEARHGDGVLGIDHLGIPKGSRGIGKSVIADLLAAADRHGLAVEVEADSTDEWGDPTMLDLVNLYRRFGFALVGMTVDDWIAMRREPRPASGGAAAILRDYGRARTDDLSDDAYHAWRAAAPDAPSPGTRTPTAGP